jgi:ElaB/YqjD/DUF883 family membrane-anchored ribosome-binding protein
MKTTTQTAEKRDALVNDLKAVINDAEDLLKNTGQQADNQYRSAKRKFEETLQNAKSGLSNLEQTMTAKTKEAVDTADQYVKSNPWQSVGIGALAGLVAGFLLLRK